MMKHLLFTSAIALFSVVTFAQSGNNAWQRSGGLSSQQGNYQRGNTTTPPKSTTQPVTQQPTVNYNSNRGNYNNTQGNKNGYNNSGNYQSGNSHSAQQPANNYSQMREYDNHLTPQKQSEYGYEQHGNDRRYVPVYHQPQYRRDYRYEQHRGHDHFDASGNYWY